MSPTITTKIATTAANDATTRIKTSRASANLRGIIIVAAAMVAATLSDQTLRLMVRPPIWSALGILGVGLTTWRAFLDNSNARANMSETTPPTTPPTTATAP